MSSGWILLGVIVVIALFVFGAYNRLVALAQRVSQAFADIDVQLKRRHDLIPNLVETVKGYASHEKETLENVIKARNSAVRADGVGATGQAEGMLSSALGKLFALSESYPDLKANQNFLQLQEELTSTENKIGFARQHYNDSVLGYNNKIETCSGKGAYYLSWTSWTYQNLLQKRSNNCKSCYNF